MINNKNMNFMIHYGPSAIHDDNIKNHTNLNQTIKSLSITPDQIDKLWPKIGPLGEYHLIRNHYDRMSDRMRDHIDRDKDLKLISFEYTKNPDHIHKAIDSGDSASIDQASQNKNLNQDHIAKILDRAGANYAYEIAGHQMNDENFEKFLQTDHDNAISKHIRIQKKISHDRLRKIIDHPGITPRQRLTRAASISIYHPSFNLDVHLAGRYTDSGEPISQEKSD